MGRKAKLALVAVAATAVVIQFFPPERTNPASDPAASFEAVVKPSPQVSAIIARARMSPERAQEVLGDMCREVKAGDMPLWQYRLLHPAAKLSAEDVTAVCALSPR